MPPKKRLICTNCKKKIHGISYKILVPVDRSAMYLLYICKDCHKRLMQLEKDEEEFEEEWKTKASNN